jgi:hypothetical protein
MVRKPLILLMLLLAFWATLGVVFWGEETRPWKLLQKGISAKPEVRELILFNGTVKERCLTCHFGIEEISPSHPIQTFGCTICHGGNGLALDKKLAHQGLLGGGNPSDYRVVGQTCGRRAPDGTLCHAGHAQREKNHAENSPKSLMATMAGVIAGLRYTWGAQDSPEALYGSVAVATAERMLKTIPLFSKDDLPGEGKGRPGTGAASGNPHTVSGQYADDQWRKFCSRCHLYSRRTSGQSTHGSGCSACHVLRDDTGRYQGRDKAMAGSPPGYGRIHRLTTAIPDTQCLRCHNRSGRIGLTYNGLMESDQYGTPYQKGQLNATRLSGDRFVLHLTADIHQEKGLRCIDCHTAREIMGDGRLYSRMYEATEIRCQDCHGTEKAEPRKYVIRSEEDPAVWASAFSKGPVLKPGEAVLSTSRGGAVHNVRRTDRGWVLYGKGDGKAHPLKIIAQQPGPHALPGHSSERMECFSCHSRWAPQCYGCHDYRKNSRSQLDPMTGIRSPGGWQETRDYFRFEDPSLGINQRNKVSPFVPGCQVLTTILDEKDKPLPGRDRAVYRRGHFSGIISGPIQPHSIRKEVRSCLACHNDPKVLGYGSGILFGGRGWKGEQILSPFQGEKAFPYSWEALSSVNGQPLQSASRAGARPFNGEELVRIRRVTPCLPCHDSYEDPIYRNMQKSYALSREPHHKDVVSRYEAFMRKGGKP